MHTANWRRVKVSKVDGGGKVEYSNRRLWHCYPNGGEIWKGKGEFVEKINLQIQCNPQPVPRGTGQK